MNVIYKCLVERLSRMLHPHEREAVLGDLTESNATTVQALRALAGFIVQRQLDAWTDWRPWLGLLGIVAASAVPLNQISRSLHQAFFRYLWIYWKHGVRYETGLTLAEDTVVFISQLLALILWTWTASFALGSLSRRNIWVSGSLFYLVLLFHDPALLVLIPSIWGLRQGLRRGSLQLSQTVLLSAAIASMTAVATWTSGWWAAALVTWSNGQYPAVTAWQTRILPYALASWPVFYIIATAFQRRYCTATVTPS